MTKDKIQSLATHNGKFHADEVTAVALLDLFGVINLSEIKIIRTRDQDLLTQADIVLDVGGIYNEQTLRFDHHQIIGGRLSSAGLIWAWIKKENANNYPQIDALIAAVDAHDCGIEMMSDFSLAQIISAYNGSDPFNDELQLKSFYAAVNVSLTLLKALKKNQDQRDNALLTIKQAEIAEIGKQRVLLLPEYCKGWQTFVNGQTSYRDITHVIWYVEQQKEWRIQVPSIRENDFALAHPKLLPDSQAKFIHQNGFLGVYTNKEAMFDMLRSLP